MVNRSKYDLVIKSMKEVCSHNSECKFENIFQNIEEIRDRFDIKLMLVGHFSAGKSSLLNALIKRPCFLKEAQGPQTAIATELIYDENENAYAYTIDGNQEPFNDSTEYSPVKY